MSSPPTNRLSADPNDERKRKRLISNRESARRSRLRKQQRQEELLSQTTQLREENARIGLQAAVVEQSYNKLEVENNSLRAQVMELTRRLQSLNSTLRFIEDFSGVELDVPEIPEPLLEPWQVPSVAGQLIVAATDMSRI